MANNPPDHHEECIAFAINFIDRAREGTVVLDWDGKILAEYQGRISATGQPGAGDEFFRHILNNLGSEPTVERIDTTGLSTTRVIIPDPSDQKFVDVVLADTLRSSIVNSTDTDWKKASTTLTQAGIGVLELCENAREHDHPIKERRRIKQRRSRSDP